MLSRKAIWAIVILMGTALIGIMLIQSYWINWSVQLNREKFDKVVYASLNEVADRLRRREIDLAMEKAIEKGAIDDTTLQVVTPYISSNPAFALSYSKSRLEAPFLKLANRPITERIDLEALDAYILQELKNRGVSMEYNYGVMTHPQRSFVIMDGHYVFDESLSEVSNTGISRGLENTPYRVDLFKDSEKLQSPGSLLIYFPKAGRKIWESVWQMLAGSFIFTALILVCFIYSIQVIFRQKKLSEMKTDFINNMTHEFKTPIATISLATDSIINPSIISDPEKIGRFAGIIKQENHRMLGQVEKVLQMALLDKQKIKLNLSDIDLHEIIDHAVEYISIQVERKDGRFSRSLDAVNHIVEGDSTHISNVIYNLLENAIKYTPEQPQIHISTNNRSNGVEIKVTDNGIGMTREQRKHIFDRFYRVHTGNLHDVKGFGLGLTYVKSMMDAHHGTVEVKSESGKGSVFTLFFPFKQPAFAN